MKVWTEFLGWVSSIKRHIIPVTNNSSSNSLSPGNYGETFDFTLDWFVLVLLPFIYY